MGFQAIARLIMKHGKIRIQRVFPGLSMGCLPDNPH